MHGERSSMYYVYLLRSINFPEKIYIGYSSDLKQRLTTHNSGSSVYTAQYRPWSLVFYLAFLSQKKAKEFELYLKSHAGRAFLQKHLL
jgi:putative endonuclease